MYIEDSRMETAAGDEEAAHMSMEIIEKLRQEGMPEIALKMIDSGIELDIIAKVKGLSSFEIEKLQQIWIMPAGM